MRNKMSSLTTTGHNNNLLTPTTTTLLLTVILATAAATVTSTSYNSSVVSGTFGNLSPSAETTLVGTYYPQFGTYIGRLRALSQGISGRVSVLMAKHSV